MKLEHRTTKRIVVGLLICTGLLVAIGMAGTNPPKSDLAACRKYDAGNVTMESVTRWYGEIADLAPTFTQNAWLWLWAHPQDRESFTSAGTSSSSDPTTRAAWDRLDTACNAVGVDIT
jgi:hypothetical protein